MADEQQADPDKPLKTTALTPAAPQGDEWGTDWESAFQAEEFLVDETEADSTLATADQFDTDDDTSLAENSRNDLTLGAREAGANTTLGDEALPAALASGPGMATRLMTWCLTRIIALPILVRLGIPIVLFLLLAGTTIFLLLERRVPPPAAPAQQASAPATPAAPTPIQTGQEVTPPVTVATPDEPAPLDTAAPQVEKAQVTWPFTAFIIPVVDEDTKASIFITVELALVVAVNNEKDGAPLARKTFVRDTIFQFFVNRPLYDLRRFALAQDELSNQLLDWLRKQWPDGEVQTVTISSYKLD